METTQTTTEVGGSTVEQELLAAERRYWQAMKENDVETTLRLTDFPCIITGPQGIGEVDEQMLATMMRSPSYSLDDFKVSDDVKVRMLRDDVAILAYRVHEEMTVDGASVGLDLVDSSTWVRRDGGWRCASHSEAIAGDPFGRDRQPIQ